MPTGVPAAEQRPRSNRLWGGQKKDENYFGQERANCSHTCESEVHRLWETWWDKHKHRVIAVRTGKHTLMWICRILEKASADIELSRSLSSAGRNTSSPAACPSPARSTGMLTCKGEGHDLPEVRSSGWRTISNPAMVYVSLGEVPDWGQRPVPVLHDT